MKNKHIKRDIFFTILKISITTLGGGILILNEIKKNLVEKKGYLKESEFASLLRLAQIVPGPIFVNFSFLLGKRAYGVLTGLLFVFAAIIPSIIIISLLAIFFNLESENVLLNKFTQGAKVAISAALLLTLFKFIKLMFSQKLKFFILQIVASFLTSILIYKYKVDISLIIFLFLILSLCFYKKRNKTEKNNAS